MTRDCVSCAHTALVVTDDGRISCVICGSVDVYRRWLQRDPARTRKRQVDPFVLKNAWPVCRGNPEFWRFRGHDEPAARVEVIS